MINFRFVTVAFFLGLYSQGFANDWPQFLGPDGAAISTDEVPVEWDDQRNLLWKFALPGAGSSSPIILGNRVFVTCFTSKGNVLTRQVVCVDKLTGKKEWIREFRTDYREDPFRGYIQEHGYASNTPATDGKQLFVFFGKGGVHSLDLEGKLLWSVDVGKESSNRQWGSASSLLLFKDRVIVNAAEESKSIIALGKATGKELWRQEAGMLELAYGTPRLVKRPSEKSELVISVPGELWSLNPDSGKVRWYAESPMTGNVSPSVIVKGDTVYSFGGYRSSGSIAVRVGGEGNVSKTHVRWSSRLSSYVATPLLHEGRFYWIDDRGTAYCMSADDGKLVYRKRVSGLSGRPVYASPVLINGKIYVVTRKGGTIVYSPGDEFKPIAVNRLTSDESQFNASPAVSDAKLFLRSDQALYCIGN